MMRVPPAGIFGNQRRDGNALTAMMPRWAGVVMGLGLAMGGASGAFALMMVGPDEEIEVQLATGETCTFGVFAQAHDGRKDRLDVVVNLQWRDSFRLSNAAIIGVSNWRQLPGEAERQDYARQICRAVADDITFKGGPGDVDPEPFQHYRIAAAKEFSGESERTEIVLLGKRECNVWAPTGPAGKEFWWNVRIFFRNEGGREDPYLETTFRLDDATWNGAKSYQDKRVLLGRVCTTALNEMEKRGQAVQ